MPPPLARLLRFVRHPVGRGASSNIYGQVVSLLVQFASLPLLLHAWGLTTYGLWVTLAAVPAYLSMSDFGFGQAAANDMSMAVAKGDEAAAGRTYQSTLALITGVSLAIAVAVAVLLALAPGAWVGALTKGDVGRARVAETLLAFAALASLNFSLVSGALRASGRYATGVMIGETTRLVETAAVAAAAFAGLGLTGAAAAALCVRLGALVGGYRYVERTISWARFSLGRADRAELKRLLGPALAVMVIPLGFALNLQGSTLVVAGTLGLAAVATFNAVRTLSRLVYQAVGVVNHAIMPEVSRAVGGADRARLQRLLRGNLVFALSTGVGVALVIAVAGRSFIQVWTHGRIRPSLFLLVGMTGVALLQSLWNSSANMLLAVNRQAGYAYALVMVSGLGIVVNLALARRFGMDGVVAGLIGCELAMCAAVVLAFRRSPLHLRAVPALAQ